MSICISAKRYKDGDKIGIRCHFLDMALDSNRGLRITTESICKCCDEFNPDHTKRSLYEELGITPPEENQPDSTGGEDDAPSEESDDIDYSELFDDGDEGEESSEE
ncbi:MAG: hypothetical protein KAS32_26105 [Candidatus Peribacteraceae bacterium]|nr:hypothetical protein [Candidatus Peribacteraceae bacterium]